MKLKNIFLSILASSLLLAGCNKDESTMSFDNLKLDQTYLTVPEEGGTVTLTVTATEDWKFVIDENWPEVVSFNKGEDGKTIKAKHDRFGNLINEEADIKNKTASWLSASALEGKAGETKVTFTVPESKAGREIEIALYAGNNKQFVRVRQGSLAPVVKTCEEILEGANVGASYIVSGTVSRLGNYASYGAFWVNDGTGEVQIYGSTKDSREKYPDVEVGDVVTFSGTWSSYKNFENAEISKHEKSLIKLISSIYRDIPKEGAKNIIVVAYKGQGVFPTIAEDCRDWVSYIDMKYTPGVPSKLVPNPADTAQITFEFAPNDGLQRSGSITLKSMNSTASSSAEINFTQAGPSYTFTKASAVESGSKYLIVAEGGALTLLDGKSYGYPENTDVTVENDQIVLTNETLAFTFTTKGTGYTIKSVGSDAYLYMTGTYNSLNWKSSEQESGDVWTVETQSDGTFKILNVDKEKWLQFDTKYSSYGAYNTQKGALPVLYKLTKVE